MKFDRKTPFSSQIGVENYWLSDFGQTYSFYTHTVVDTQGNFLIRIMKLEKNDLLPSLFRCFLPALLSFITLADIESSSSAQDFCVLKVIGIDCLPTLPSFSKQSASWKVFETCYLCALSTGSQNRTLVNILVAVAKISTGRIICCWGIREESRTSPFPFQSKIFFGRKVFDSLVGVFFHCPEIGSHGGWGTGGGGFESRF